MDVVVKEMIEDYNDINEKNACKLDVQRMIHKNEIHQLRERVKSLEEENLKLKSFLAQPSVMACV